MLSIIRNSSVYWNKIDMPKNRMTTKIIAGGFAVLLIVCGLMVIVMGIHVESVRNEHRAISTFPGWSTALVITLAHVLISTGLVGVMGIWREQISVIKAFLILSVVVLLLEFCVGVACFVYVEVASKAVTDRIKFDVEGYGMPEQQVLTEAIDKLQREFKCCGAEEVVDWHRNGAYTPCLPDVRNLSIVCPIPESCCSAHDVQGNCSYKYDVEANRVTVSNHFVMGCKYAYRKWMETHMDVLGLGCLVIIIPQVAVGVVLHWLVKTRDMQKFLYTTPN